MVHGTAVALRVVLVGLLTGTAAVGSLRAREGQPQSQGQAAPAPTPTEAQRLEQLRIEQDQRTRTLDARQKALDEETKKVARQQQTVADEQARLTKQRDQLDGERFGEKGPIGENGITIGRAKIFDNRTLTLLLENLSETLRGLQVIDQDPLKKALGAIQGSQTQDVSRSFSVLAGGSPKVVTTHDDTTQADLESKVTTGKGKDDGKEKESVEAMVDRKLSEKLGFKQETTTPERTPSQPGLPDLIAGPSGGIPSFGQNAADLLTDQVNLSYQILNLRMVIERSLSDRLVGGKPRLQAVLGFNVSIDPPRDAENSAAIVEVTIRTVDDKPVALVAMMPQEKTYNAVSMTTKSNAFGGSAVAGMFTVGYSERRRGQVFYLYRDNDTLSFERMITQNDALTFGWQFRPVLGRKSVSPGLRQMFAVISMPVADANEQNATNAVKALKVSTRTYWRKYHGDTLTTSDRNQIGAWPYLRRFASLGLSEAVPNGREARRVRVGQDETVEVPLTANYQDHLKPKVNGVQWTRIDEKTALISVDGDNFFSGTSVAMGGTAAAAGVVIKSNQALDIVTPIENVGAGTAMLIGRYGQAQALTVPGGCMPRSWNAGSTLAPAIAGYRELTVFLDCPIADVDQHLAVFANGKHVPGMPLVAAVDPKDPAKGIAVSAQVPLTLFPGNEGTLAVVSPFRGPFRVEFPWYDNPYVVTRIEGDGKTIVFIRRSDDVALTNSRTWDLANEQWTVQYRGKDQALSFPNSRLMRFDLAENADGSLLLFEPLKHRPMYLLELPEAKPRPKEAVEPVGGGPIVINQNDGPRLQFTGERIADVATVRFEGRDPFRQEYDAKKKVLSVDVPQEATKLPATRVMLLFRDAAGKSIAAIPIEVKAIQKPGSETKVQAKP